ncbi:MAG: hypothetical protein LBD37_02750 [Treponema sp.]|jgi:hypothetical protein|nr:hypothetical protein [Treponema sp.]
MIRIELIANHSVEENILEALSREEAGKFYTKYPTVFGVGSMGPRMGDAIWPEENFAMVIWCDEDEARRVERAIASVKQQFPDEGIKLFGIFAGASAGGILSGAKSPAENPPPAAESIAPDAGPLAREGGPAPGTASTRNAGEAAGLAKALEQGRRERALADAERLLAYGLSAEQTAAILELPLEEVRGLPSKPNSG